METQGRRRQDVYADFRNGVFPSPIRYAKERLGKPQPREIELTLIERETIEK